MDSSNTPFGLMDGGAPGGAEYFNKEHYSLCDMSDEEVHYSREPIGLASPSSNQYLAYTSNNRLQSHNQFPQTSSTYQYCNLDGGESHFGSVNFTDLSLNSGYHVQTSAVSAAEQAKSSKLLQVIGSKLKKGSNFLAAPKLVGQYLLGITIQNWSEFLNLSNLMRAPSNRHQWTRRLLNNLNYFQGNYLCVSLVLVIYCILTSPLLLLAILAYLGALYLVTARSATGRHLVLAGGFRPNLRQQYSFITLVTVPLLWVAGAPSAVFWVIGASFVVVGVHASMFCPDTANEATPEQQQHQVATAQQVIATVAQRKHSQRTQDNLSQLSARHPNNYLPLPGSASLPSVSGQASERKQSLGYSSTITQWILSGGKQKSSAPLQQETRVPEVTIISQDYAGLGRVYEV